MIVNRPSNESRPKHIVYYFKTIRILVSPLQGKGCKP